MRYFENIDIDINIDKEHLLILSLYLEGWSLVKCQYLDFQYKFQANSLDIRKKCFLILSSCYYIDLKINCQYIDNFGKYRYCFQYQYGEF